MQQLRKECAEKPMITESVLLNTLCVPCACRCRYCLLSCDGGTVGASWQRSAELAIKFKEGLSKTRPELKFAFAFGCSMEHPELPAALEFLRQIGSPQAEYLQCDGMRMRTDAECASLAQMLADHGAPHLNFTFYGLQDYHDRFAGRRGDFTLMLRMMGAAQAAGLKVSAGIPLTKESAPQADELIARLREQVGDIRVFLFIPHEEGRGVVLDGIRFTEDELSCLSPEAHGLLNSNIFRPEKEWLGGAYVPETKRQIIISLREDNILRYESMLPADVVAETEALDDAYYAAFPSFEELAERYGESSGSRFYRQRDLFYHYRRLYAEEFNVRVYDVTDERQSGSRRY